MVGRWSRTYLRLPCAGATAAAGKVRADVEVSGPGREQNAVAVLTGEVGGRRAAGDHARSLGALHGVGGARSDRMRVGPTMD